MYEFTHRLPHEPWRKPSRNEEEYFRRRELEARLKRAWEREMAREAEERRRFREFHQDRCPSCAERLEVIRIRESEARQCPECRGVWLDRELFDTLTHRERSPLAELFRSQILEYSLGAFHEAEERLQEKEGGR